jgi:succinate dehydrogenase/fumarate reductase flavoprotein subunit
MTRNINDASLANLKHYEGKWKHGQTRTIRIPISLADATLEYARQLDKGIEPRDTANSVSTKLEVNVTQSPVSGDSSDEVKQLKDEVERLQNELGNLRNQSELPEAADLLNRLKAKRKKSTASLADVEALLKMIEGKAQKGN